MLTYQFTPLSNPFQPRYYLQIYKNRTTSYFVLYWKC